MIWDEREMMKKRLAAFMLALIMALSLTACGSNEDSAADGEKILRIAESFAYPSLDAHKEYYGWYTSIYGITEALFKMGDDSSVQPCLAESAEVSDNGLTWTVTIRDGICFSNGEGVTSEDVIENLKRVGDVNIRFSQFADYEYTAIDDSVFTIKTSDIYPTLVNDLASPEMAILDLEATDDFDNAPVATGPFVIKSFEPEGTVEVARNDNYWGGEVKLDGAIFYYMQDDESKLMAMQNGEIDCYTSVTAAAKEIYDASPDKYTVTDIPATRLQFYMLNQNKLSDKLRAAINLTIDCDAIAAYLNGTVTAATGPFGTSTAYGKAVKPAVDTAAAKAAIEAEGYTLGSDGIYEKNGEDLELNICYYNARSLDSLALLMQEQLKSVGIDSTLTAQEDADATYVLSGDYDIALYCMIADKNGDPYYFIDTVLRPGGYWVSAGFENAEVSSLIDNLQVETAPSMRTETANKIVQIAIDDNAIGCVGLFNNITVSAKNVSGIHETSPFDFYRIDSETYIN